MGGFNIVGLLSLDLHDRIIKTHDPTPSTTSSDLPIGSIFVDSKLCHDQPSKKFLIVKAEKPGSCRGCDLFIEGVCWKIKKLHCSAYSRFDKTWVILKEYNGPIK